MIILRIVGALVATILTIGWLFKWFQTYVVGAYYVSSGFTLAAFGAAFPVIIIALWVYAMYSIFRNR